MHTGNAYVWKKKGEAYNPKNTPTKVFHCGDASVHLEKGIPSWWKESWRKKDMRRFWKKSISSQQHWVWVIALSFWNIHCSRWRTTSWGQSKHYWLACTTPWLESYRNMWGELKIKVHARRPSNLEALERFAIEECTGIYSGVLSETCWKWQQKTLKGYPAKRIHMNLLVVFGFCEILFLCAK